MKIKQPLVLCIMDGWGIGHDDQHNPIFLAKTPTIDHLCATYSNTIIGAAGVHVGLTPGHQGSSEIGHMIIGAGRNALLPQTQIKQATESGEIKKLPVYKKALKGAKRVHLMGLLSDKGVHAYDETCHTLLEMCKEHKIPEVYIHVISDGRDVMPKTVKKYLARLGKDIDKVASIQGRYWIMDRDQRWERVKKAYRMLTQGIATREAKTANDAVEQAYKNEETDEFIKPTLIKKEGVFRDGDVVINFNYRVDRAIEITQALVEKQFGHFPRETKPKIKYIALTNYYEGIPCDFAFERPIIKNCIGEVLSKEHLTQFRCTETEKWAYLTKIFNGLIEDPFPGEVRKLIPSDKVATYDLKPEMQAMEIAKAVANHLHEKSFDVYFINFANPDMLGHTGNKKAIIKGIQTVDTALNLVYEAVLNQNGRMLITSDHGDAEVCWDDDECQPHTSHTDSHVPFIFIDENNKQAKLREDGILADIAPTMLKLLKIKKPAQMTGSSIII